MSTTCDHPSFWAVSYEQLMEVERKAKAIFGALAYHRKTMRDINKHIIIPCCQESGTSYALNLNRSQPHGGLKLDAFITHCWDEVFADFVRSIRKAFSPYTTKPNLWICAFALTQGDPEIVQEQVGTKETSLRDSPFVQALEEASWFVVVRNSRTDLYSRIWCVCELMYAKKFGFTTTNKTMVIGPADKFSKSRSSCVNAHAEYDVDKERILQLLEEDNSVDEIDELVLQYRTHGDEHRGFRRFVLPGLLPLVVIATIAAVGIWLGVSSPWTNSNDTNTTSSPMLSPPSLSPSQQPSQYPDMPLQFLPEYTRQEIASNATSPQALALDWLIQAYPTFFNMEKWRQQQLFALVTLYYSTGGYHWHDSGDTGTENYWLDASRPECAWPNAFNPDCTLDGRYQTLDIVDRAYGPVPPELSLLTSLKFLKLTPGLVGHIPTELGALSSLEVLDFDYSLLSGNLPTEFGSMSSLRSLSLVENSLTERLPTELGSLSLLEELFLRNNSLSWALPTEIGSMTSLYNTDLSFNDLIGTLPTELGRMVSMVYLYLHSNNFSGSVPSELSLLERLDALRIYDTQLTGAIPSGACSLPDLVEVQVDCDKVDCSCPLGQCRYCNETCDC